MKPGHVLPGMRVAICFLFLALTAPARAAWFADLYAGVAYTPRSDVTVVVSRPGVSPDHTFHDVKWDNSTVLGGRAGHWFTAAPWYGVESGRDSSTGYKAGGGLSWQLATSAAIFAEYRFTHVHSEVLLRGTITGGQVPVKFDLDTHHLVAGLSFSF